jgi:hypothetical protein
LALRVALGKHETRAKGSRHLVPNDQASNGRRRHYIHIGARQDFAQFAGQSLAQLLGMTWMLKNQRALEVLGTMQPACQAEVPLKMSACLAKYF